MVVSEWLSIFDMLQSRRPRMDIVDECNEVTGEVKLSDTGMISIELFSEREQFVFSLSEFACLFRFYKDFVGEGSFHPTVSHEGLEEKTPSQKLEETARDRKEETSAPVSNAGTDSPKSEPVTHESAAEGPAEEKAATLAEGYEK